MRHAQVRPHYFSVFYFSMRLTKPNERINKGTYSKEVLPEIETVCRFLFLAAHFVRNLIAYGYFTLSLRVVTEEELATNVWILA